MRFGTDVDGAHPLGVDVGARQRLTRGFDGDRDGILVHSRDRLLDQTRALGFAFRRPTPLGRDLGGADAIPRDVGSVSDDSEHGAPFYPRRAPRSSAAARKMSGAGLPRRTRGSSPHTTARKIENQSRWPAILTWKRRASVLVAIAIGMPRA